MTNDFRYCINLTEQEKLDIDKQVRKDKEISKSLDKLERR